MTCIVACRERSGIIVMGCDSHVSDGHLVKTVPTKIAVHFGGKLLIGCAGAIRMLNLMQHELRFSEEEAASAFTPAWIHTVLVNKVRDAVIEGNAIGEDSGWQFLIQGGELLIAMPGALYTMDSGFALTPVTESFAAIGSGGEVAMGALYTTQWTKNDAEYRVIQALTTAAAIAAFVRGPFHIERIAAP